MVFFSKLGKRPNQALIGSIIDQLEGMSTRLTSIHDELKDVRYPFDHANDNMTLQEFVIPNLPEPMDMGGLVDKADLPKLLRMIPY